MNRFCTTSRCHASGPEEKFIKCRVCDVWVCHAHADTSDGVTMVRQANGDPSYRALCLPCRRRLDALAKQQGEWQGRTVTYVVTRHYCHAVMNGSMPATIYQAVRPLVCVGCQQSIHPGELFTRHQRAKDAPPLTGKRPRSQPYCRSRCYPLGAVTEYREDVFVAGADPVSMED